ncbi:flavin monoamine oxidase family protein [Actinophytocola sediminis]
MNIRNDRRESRLSRRQLLIAGGAALAAGGATIAATATGVAGAATGDSADAPTYDAIVVGAGFAGAIAARELRAQGLRTLILEARNRIGGRTWTETFEGEVVELGGQFVDSSMPLVTAELRRYNIPTVAGLPLDQAIVSTTGGFTPMSVGEFVGRQGELLARLFEGSTEYFPMPHNPLYRRDLIGELDVLSLRDRLNQLNLSELDERLINGTTAGQSGGSSTYGALTALAQWWALVGWNAENWYQAQSQRIKTGMVSLETAILNEAGAELRLNSPVSSINDTGGAVVVTTTSGAAYSARTVVVAVPVNMWRTIRFSPGLPQVHRTASTEGVGVPNARKMWLMVRGVADSVMVNGAENDTFMTVISQSRIDTDVQIMMALNSLPALDVSNSAAIEQALQQVLPGTQLLSHRTHDWGADPFSRGGWALRRPGQLTAQLPAIQQPHGRIAFATSDIASGWVGFVEGALESGASAGQQAIELAALAGRR